MVCMLQVIFYFSKFYFSFVSNSLAYITAPRNKGKTKINWNRKLSATRIKPPKATLVCFDMYCSYSIANDPETANDPAPQVIPKDDRKWCRKKNRNGLDSG